MSLMDSSSTFIPYEFNGFFIHIYLDEESIKLILRNKCG
jgi:hypothetical protein